MTDASDRSERRGRRLSVALVVTIALAVSGLGASHAFRRVEPCGDSPEIDVRFAATDLGPSPSGMVYRVTAPTLATDDVARLAAALGVVGPVVTTPGGFRIDTDLNPFTLDRTALGWLLSSDVREDAITTLRDDLPMPLSKRGARIVARRLVEHLGISTAGWKAEGGSLPDPEAGRVVSLTPSIEALHPFRVDQWSIEVSPDGAFGLVDGLILEAVRAGRERILDAEEVATTLESDDDPFATAAVVAAPRGLRGNRSRIITSFGPEIPLAGHGCDQLVAIPLPPGALIDARVQAAPPRADVGRHVQYEVVGVAATSAFLASDRSATAVLLVPAYRFRVIRRIAGQPDTELEIGPRLAVDPDHVLAELGDRT